MRWLEYLIIKNSDLFDPNFYLEENPDVKKAGIHPLWHFINKGWKESRDPSEYFDTSFYLDTYPDVKLAGTNPLVHYLRFGRFEGRKPSEYFTPNHLRNPIISREFTVTQPSFYRRISLLAVNILKSIYRWLPLPEAFKFNIKKYVNQHFSGVYTNYKTIVARKNYLEAIYGGDQLLSLPIMRLDLFPYNKKFPSYYAQLFKNDKLSSQLKLIDPPWYENRVEKVPDRNNALSRKQSGVDNIKFLVLSLINNNTPAHFINGMINSVIMQSHNNWELHLFFDKNSIWYEDILSMQYQEINEGKIRIHYVDYSQNILSPMYLTVSKSDNDFVIFLNPYDELSLHSLSSIAERIVGNKVDIVYSKAPDIQILKDKLPDTLNINKEIPYGQLVAIKKEGLLSILSPRSETDPDLYSFFSALISATSNDQIEIGEENYLFRKIPGRYILAINRIYSSKIIVEGVVPLKLVIDARLIGRQVTGTERTIIELLKNLSKVQREYHLIIKAISDDKPSIAIEGVEFVTKQHFAEILNSHVFHKTFPASDSNTLSELALAPSVTFQPLDLIAYNNPDYFLDEQSYFNFRQNLKLAAKLSDRIIAISEHGKLEIERLLDIPAQNIKAIYLGIHQELFNKKADNDGYKLAELKIPKDYFLFIGTDYPHKNLVTLLRALKIALNSIPEVKLVIVGAHYYIRPQPEINYSLRFLGNRVIHLGHVTDEILVSLYQHAKALIFPSLYEGFGLPILEAMAASTPVITTRDTSIPEVCNNSALFFDGQNAQELSDLMVRIWSDEGLRHELIKLGLANVKRFDWDKTAKQTISVYWESIQNSVRLSPYQKSLQKRKVIKSLSKGRPAILIVTHIRLYPPTAGNEQRLFKLVKFLKKMGYQVIMLVNPFMENAVMDNQRRREIHEYVDYYEEVADYPIGKYHRNQVRSKVNRSTILEKWKSVEYNFCPDELMAKVKRLIAIYSPKILLAEYIWTSRIFELARKDTLKVIDLHDLFSQKKDKVTKYGIQDGLAITRDEELEFINRSDLALAIQENEAAILRECNPVCEVISAGIDHEYFTYSEAINAKKSILIIGSDNQINRQCVNEFLVNAWPKILQKCPECTLTIVGKVCNTIQGVHQNVEFVPYIEKLGQLYCETTLVINPVYAGTGLKIKSVEALGFGKALISWPEGVWGITADNGSPPYIVINSWEMLIEKTNELLRNDAERIELERLAKEYSERNLSDIQVYKQVGDRFDIHTRRELKILCMYLRYGPNDYPGSFEKLMDWYQNKQQNADVNLSVWIIDNKIDREYDGVDIASGFRLISGDNSQREFSGFQKVIDRFKNELNSYDVIHFVTSAYNQLYTKYLEYFDLNHLYPIIHRPLCLGHIDSYDLPISLLGYTSQSWIRTCFFFISPQHLSSVKEINILKDKNRFFNKKGGFLNNGNIDDEYKNNLQKWLRGEQMQGMAWHGTILDESKFAEKALTILNEHMLSIKMRAMGINLVDFYWLKKNIDIVESRFDFPIPGSMDQIKFRQTNLFNM